MLLTKSKIIIDDVHYYPQKKVRGGDDTYLIAYYKTEDGELQGHAFTAGELDRAAARYEVFVQRNDPHLPMPHSFWTAFKLWIKGII